MKRLIRWTGLIIAAAGAVWAYQRAFGYLRDYIDRRLYPAITVRSPLAEAIERESRARRLNEFASEYRRVQALIEAARAQGLNVGGMENKLPYAWRLAQQGRFADAKMQLNIAEMLVPRARKRQARP